MAEGYGAVSSIWRDRVFQVFLLALAVVWGIVFALLPDDHVATGDGPKVSDNPPVIGTTRYPLTINGDVWWCLTDQPPDQGEVLRVTSETRLLDCQRQVNVHG